MIDQKLAQLLSDTLGLDASEIGPGTAMANTPAWDSVMHLNVCMSVEEAFGITLAPEQMIAMTSVAAIEEVLRKNAAA